MSPAQVVLAHEAALHALPLVLPAFIVVALLAAIVHRDRRAQRREKGGA